MFDRSGQNLTIEVSGSKSQIRYNRTYFMDSGGSVCDDGEDYLLENISVEFKNFPPSVHFGASTDAISFDMEGAGRRFPGGEISFEGIAVREKVLEFGTDWLRWGEAFQLAAW